MKLKLISADHPDGVLAEWAAVPSCGDVVILHHHLYSVEVVRWLIADDHTLSAVEVHLCGCSASVVIDDDEDPKSVEISH